MFATKLPVCAGKNRIAGGHDCKCNRIDSGMKSEDAQTAIRLMMVLAIGLMAAMTGPLSVLAERL
jgi:hypothetical protein